MIQKAFDIKLNVRPICLGAEHLYYYEGPCRFGKGEALQPGYDRLANEQLHQGFLAELAACASGGINILPPFRAGRTDDWDNKEDMWTSLTEGMQDTDLYIFFSNIAVDDLVVEFATRYRKPLMISPTSNFSVTTDVAAILAKIPDYPVYAECTWSGVSKTMDALRAKKVLANTRILLATRFGSTTSYSSVDSFNCYDTITNRFGTRFRFVNIHELIDQMSPAKPEGNHTTPGRKTPDLTDEDMQEVNRLADEMLGGTGDIGVTREKLIKTLIPYVTVKKNLDLKDCNGFSVPCPDVCSTRRLNEEQFTFCLTHSLLMEQGIPSACEFDVNSVLSQQTLIAVSNMVPYMGNTSPLPLVDGKFMGMWGPTDTDRARLLKDEGRENVYYMQHSVPNRCMRSPGKKEPYALRHFAYDQEFGAVLRYDFNRDIGQTVTLCRYSPDGGKLMIGKGTVLGGGAYELNNCNTQIFFRVADQEDFFKKQAQVGNHMALVYGDYTKELERLGQMLGVEIIKA
jgi:L-fucose isomerase-like protein